MKERLIIFITAFSQVTFVAMQPVFIIAHAIIPMLITGFLISLIWTFNVKKVAFGDNWDRVIYATGAMAGTGFGFYISHLITKQV